MGQKVNPHGLRVGINAPWSSTWFANKKDFGKNLKEDNEIRNYLKKNYYDAALPVDTTAKKDAPEKGIDQINAAIRKIVGPNKSFNVNVHEVKHIDTDAQLIAENIASALEKRTPFRRAMKSVMGRAMRAGAKGVKTMVSGRLDGAEIARSESYHEGSIPLQTLRADIDYGFAEAHTTYGIIGVKAWIYKGEVFKAKGGKD